MIDTKIAHAFTVDVEEYFHANVFDGVVSPSQWDSISSRVGVGTDKLLSILGENDVSGTFFVLSWVAERHPDLIRKISQAGHEIASHGYLHRRVMHQTMEAFRSDVRKSKDILEQLTGEPVKGYRAPSFSIVAETEWALEVLVEEGYSYDSSRFPIARQGYGSPHISWRPHVYSTPSGRLAELPMTVWMPFGRRLPAAGGGWFRQFPEWFNSRAFGWREAAAAPSVFYIHPWELDEDQPRIDLPLLSRVRHYRGIDKVEGRIRRMLSKFTFGPINGVFNIDALLESGIANEQ